MQRCFTIELRCDYEDEDKYAEVWKSCLEAAVLLHRLAALINDSVPPQIEVGGDDYWHGNNVLVKLSKLLKQYEDEGRDFAVTDELLRELGIEGPNHVTT